MFSLYKRYKTLKTALIGTELFFFWTTTKVKWYVVIIPQENTWGNNESWWDAVKDSFWKLFCRTNSVCLVIPAITGWCFDLPGFHFGKPVILSRRRLLAHLIALVFISMFNLNLLLSGWTQQKTSCYCTPVPLTRYKWDCMKPLPRMHFGVNNNSSLAK